ncbi:MAG: DUF559 domain-containing protein [Nostoc sp. ChiQUE01a]|nr:DUF559 domain-containing protein [Nostoc sp. ChiQUE01a]
MKTLMTKLYNQTSEKQKRQTLRNNMPPCEKIVWAKLRNQQIESCKFRSLSISEDVLTVMIDVSNIFYPSLTFPFIRGGN